MRVRWLLILAGLFLVLAAGCMPDAPDTPIPTKTVVPQETVIPTKTPAPTTSEGILAGSVVIGPICPVEPCPRGIGDTYSSRELQLQSESASGILIHLGSDGTFSALVPTGEYVVSVSNCDFFGCSRGLPVTVVIRD